MMKSLIGLLTVAGLVACMPTTTNLDPSKEPEKVDTTPKAVTCAYSMKKDVLGINMERVTIRPKEFGGGLIPEKFLYDTAAVIWVEEYYRDGFPKRIYTQSDLMPICLTDSISTLDTTWVRFVPKGDPVRIDFNL